MTRTNDSQSNPEAALTALGARVDELEMRGAFNDQSQADLSDALAAESKRINELQAKIERLEKQLEALFQGAGTAAPEPPPPHY
jgi:SlyX protein